MTSNHGHMNKMKDQMFIDLVMMNMSNYGPYHGYAIKSKKVDKQ